MRAGCVRKLKHRPRKVILKGKYYCPIVPELGHYENEGLWGYDKLVYVDNGRYRFVSCLFKTKNEMDLAYKEEVKNIHELGKCMLKRKTNFIENELDDLESKCEKTPQAYKVVEGKTVKLMF